MRNRFKEKIEPMDKASETLFSLKPVTFRYKKEIDPAQPLSFGLIAEEVARINPELITRNEDGKPQTVRYEAVNAMLLNEFLKEHRKVEEQAREIREQKAVITRLKASVAKQEATLVAVNKHLNQQDSKIQKVSDRIELSKFATGRLRGGGPAPRVATTRP